MMGGRWLVYQRERFPLLAHGPLVLAFSFCAVSYSAMLRGESRWPDWRSIVVAFITALLFFLQLRIADEFKDFEEDSKFRPYRPVPRGLVKLRELAIVGIIAGLIQLGLALWLKPTLVLWLLIPWIYFALMSKEFFVRRWLVARPFTYMWTHMLVMPLIDLYATACDWHVAGGEPPKSLIWFLLASYFNGMVIEIGRKIRAPGGEEEGVTTYSRIWTIKGALAAWLAAMVMTAGFATIASRQIGFDHVFIWIMIGGLLVAAMCAWRMAARPSGGGGKMIEAMSGLWTLMLYLGLGAVPRIIS
jgi:4-hydroxybenzoate polyprenyltransferase